MIFCFYECWSVKEWIINDNELKNDYPNIKKRVDTYVENNNFIKMSFDIANREKHLELRNIRTGGEIKKSQIEVHYNELITVGISDIKINLIPVDDLEKYDAAKKIVNKQKPISNNNIKTSQSKNTTRLTQEYIVYNDKGESFNALYVIEKTVEAWEILINSL